MTVPQGGSVITGPTKAIVSAESGKPKVDGQFTLESLDPIGSRGEYLFYGAPGSGKTVCASTFPKPFRWIDADGGLKSLLWAIKAGKTKITDLATDLIAYRPTEPEGGYVSSPAAFDLMTDMIDFWFSPTEVDKWLTLVLDSFTTINEWALNKALTANFRLPTTKHPLSRSHGINKEAEARIITGQQDYKSAMAFVDTFLQDVRIKAARHGKNLICICHEYLEEERDDDRGIRRIIHNYPLLTGKLRERISKDFDDVWHFTMHPSSSGPEVRVRVHAGNKEVAKTRWGGFLPTELPPDYDYILNEVRKFHSAPAADGK